MCRLPRTMSWVAIVLVQLSHDVRGARQVVARLAGEDESWIDILRPSELLSRLLANGRDGAGAHLALVGDPPEDGIGFALVRSRRSVCARGA